MYNETVARLEKFTDPSEFERLSADILYGVGYASIEPQSVGRKDGGKDALLFSEKEKIVFHFSLEQKWKTKIEKDVEKTRNYEKEHDLHFSKFIFVSNRMISGISKDSIREEFMEKYDWEVDIFDVERLRVILDNDRRDLRIKYLNIPIGIDSPQDNLIEYFTNKWDDTSSTPFIPHQKRLLLIAVPNKLSQTRMHMFDSKSKFVGDEKRYIDTLKGVMPLPYFSHKIGSNCFSLHHKIHPEEENTMFSPLTMAREEEYEASIYLDGVIEIVHDLQSTNLDQQFISGMLTTFYSIIESLYSGVFDNDEFLTIGVIIINASGVDITKGKYRYYGESRTFSEVTSCSFEDIKKQEFKNELNEIIQNKILNFFNDLYVED